MCIDCYRRYIPGDPPPETAGISRARGLIEEIYDTEWGVVGGMLHVEVEDNNLDDRFFTEEGWQQILDVSTRFSYVSAEEYDLCRRTWEALRVLTPAERLVACMCDAEVEGFRTDVDPK